jgi:hypothetical protein
MRWANSFSVATICDTMRSQFRLTNRGLKLTPLDLELEQAGLGAPADGATLRHDEPRVPDGAALHRDGLGAPGGAALRRD